MTCAHLELYQLQFLEWEMLQTKVEEKIETHILCSINYFRKSCPVAIMWGKKYDRDEVTDGSK
jgi:hypothetical protein